MGRRRKLEKPAQGKPEEEKRLGLTREEQETIICFNKGEQEATVFTYEYRWQKHIEKKMGIEPFMVNKFGGKEYKMDKHRISMPRVPNKIKHIMSPEQKVKVLAALKRARDNR